MTLYSTADQSINHTIVVTDTTIINIILLLRDHKSRFVLFFFFNTNTDSTLTLYLTPDQSINHTIMVTNTTNKYNFTTRDHESRFVPFLIQIQSYILYQDNTTFYYYYYYL